ncbi:oligosaccharide flippase family protein [Lacticaseibacillus sp. GG6-2]
MKLKKTTSDIIYNGLYQVVILFLPFMTQPYLYRVMHEEAMGINALINSIPSLLSVLILFGMNQFGVRTMAQSKREDRAKTFAKLWTVQLVVGLVVMGLYALSVVLFLDYKFYYLLELPYLLGFVIDISWCFVGLGDIKKVILRNTLIKLLIVSSVFLLIHSPKDLWLYLLINSVTYLANIIFWIDLPHLLGTRPKRRDFGWVNRYFIQALLVTLPTIATQLYISFDQQLVGRLAGVIQLNYYAYPQNMARAVIAVAGSVSSVLMPKMAKMMTGDSGHTGVVRLLKTSLDYTLVLAVYLCVAFMINAIKFTQWFWAAKNATMGWNMFWGSLIIILVSYGGVYANQYTLSRGLFKIYSIPYYCGAAVSVSLNILLVPHFGSIGATFVIVFTESIVLFLRMFLVRHELPLRQVVKGEWTTLVCGGVTLAIGLLLPMNTGSLFIDLVLQTVLLTVVFLLMLFVTGNRVMKDILHRIAGRQAA